MFQQPRIGLPRLLPLTDAQFTLHWSPMTPPVSSEPTGQLTHVPFSGWAQAKAQPPVFLWTGCRDPWMRSFECKCDCSIHDMVWVINVLTTANQTETPLRSLVFVSRCASASGGWRGMCRLHVELEGERLSDFAGAIISGHEQLIRQGRMSFSGEALQFFSLRDYVFKMYSGNLFRSYTFPFSWPGCLRNIWKQFGTDVYWTKEWKHWNKLIGNTSGIGSRFHILAFSISHKYLREMKKTSVSLDLMVNCFR